MKKTFAALAFVFLLLGLLAWVSDWVTLQGEHTIYTVNCQGGEWKGLACSGKLAAGERYRFRSSKSRGEVLFWIAYSSAPSGKFTGCRVQSRDNWSCPRQEGQPPTVAHELLRGRPTGFVPGYDKPYRAVSKLKWLLLELDLTTGRSADYGEG